MNAPKRIAVLLTCYNRRKNTLDCLTHLFRQQIPENYSFEVFLVDDNSTDGTGDAVRESFPKVTIIKGTGKLFWNRGMYTAWSEAEKRDPDFYLWLNDDTELIPGTLCVLETDSGEMDHKSIIVGTTVDNNGALSYGGYAKGKTGIIPPTPDLTPCDSFNGNVVWVPRSVYRQIGKLDWHFRHSIGDLDYGLRAKKFGISCMICRKLCGVCERHAKPVLWCRPEVPFLSRVRNLYSPLGNSYPVCFFIFEYRHYGLWQALKHVVSIHLRLLFPQLWCNR